MDNPKTPPPCTKEDNNIKYTCKLLDDNENKLNSIDQLNACIDKITNQPFEECAKINLINVLESVKRDLKTSYMIIKDHLKHVNPQYK